MRADTAVLANSINLQDKPSVPAVASSIAEIELSACKTKVKVISNLKSHETITARELRSLARDAASRRSTMTPESSRRETDTHDLQITDIKPIGNYGINIQFSDNHAQAIYPFEILLAKINAKYA